jgi:hypothetical protein
MIVWHTWALTVAEPAEELALRLERDEGAGDVLPAVDALLRTADSTAAASTVELLSDETLRPSYASLGTLLQQAVRARNDLRSQLARQEGNVARQIAERLSRPFLALEGVVYGYFRLRAILADAGWRQIAPALGDSLSHADLDPARHEVRHNEDADRFVVRSLGIEIDGEPVVRAVVEGLDSN